VNRGPFFALAARRCFLFGVFRSKQVFQKLPVLVCFESEVLGS
jgi:hypothetical protein